MKRFFSRSKEQPKKLFQWKETQKYAQCRFFANYQLNPRYFWLIDMMLPVLVVTFIVCLLIVAPFVFNAMLYGRTLNLNRMTFVVVSGFIFGCILNLILLVNRFFATHKVTLRDANISVDFDGNTTYIEYSEIVYYTIVEFPYLKQKLRFFAGKFVDNSIFSVGLPDSVSQAQLAQVLASCNVAYRSQAEFEFEFAPSSRF